MREITHIKELTGSIIGGGVKNDIVLYKRIYQLLKNQIECGILPVGGRLPSRAELCREFQVSEKTVRRVLKELLKDGLIETQQRKLPIIKSAVSNDCKTETAALQGNTHVPEDIFNTGRLFCYPVIENGVALCVKEEWKIPEAIAERMNPAHAVEFWRFAHCFWRFFVARNSNDFILRAVDSLGFFNIEPASGSFELRKAYLKDLRSFIEAAKEDGYSEKALFGSLSSLYGIGGNGTQSENCYRMMPDSSAHAGLCGIEQRLRSAEERYSRVYMDIIGLIAIGRYRPGDLLPTHKELQKIYAVSSDTTAKAINVLKEWGVVTAKRGSGIYVSMDLAGLKNVKISPDLVGCHLRRFLDSLELLNLTIDKVTKHTSAFILKDEARELLQEMKRLWDEEYLYQLTPIVLLEFITEYIQYLPLKEIYRVISKYYHIGRCIPSLVTHDKSSENIAIQCQATEAVECLIRGGSRQFSEKAAAMFRYVYKLVIRECERLGYLDIAAKVYDGTALWKKTYFLTNDDT